ncbi:MAG TPA: hydantoinase B/oxoprolinase family protein, partial [Acidimicrobiales bacterium]|nr:hydantoinase B/oxoprolinase family protein [Acidimicrobiales bacterium]
MRATARLGRPGQRRWVADCHSERDAQGGGPVIDAIELEVVWASLISTVNEQAKALQRSAFSPIVREAGDLANALFDRR